MFHFSNICNLNTMISRFFKYVYFQYCHALKRREQTRAWLWLHNFVCIAESLPLITILSAVIGGVLLTVLAIIFMILCRRSSALTLKAMGNGEKQYQNGSNTGLCIFSSPISLAIVLLSIWKVFFFFAHYLLHSFSFSSQ